MNKTVVNAIAAALASAILCCGCAAHPRYVEGTSTQIGLYIPVSGQIYGLQCLNYLNGCVVNANSNHTITVQRECSVTNSYFGCIETVEWSKTKVDVK